MSETATREFTYTQDDFDYIRKLVTERTGIVLSENKYEMVYGRVSRRLRTLHLTNFKDYIERIAADQDELIELTNALTTNLTYFFREEHHFEYLAQVLLPELRRQKRHDRSLRIWSSACSTGEEPYTLSMVLLENLPPQETWDVRILASDLDSRVLEKAESGVYDLSKIKGLSDARLKRWCQQGSGAKSGMMRIRPSVKELVSFRQLNLIGEWPMKGPFDFIFCRNVVIYFDKDTQKRLFDRMATLLPMGGILFVGHSESLFKVTDRFEIVEKSIYRRVL